MDKYQELIERSKKFKKSFADNIINLEPYFSTKSIEEEITFLQKLNEFLDAKLQIADHDSLSKSKIEELNKNKQNVNYESELFKNLLRKNISGKLGQTLYLSAIIEDLFMKSTNDNPEIQTVKENILKQSENLLFTNNVLMKLSIEQNKLTEKIAKEKINLKEEQNVYKENLTAHTEMSSQNTNTELYKNSLLSCEKRIEKINFMRVLATQLLIQRHTFTENEETIKIIERLRSPVTLDTLKDMPIDQE